MKKLSPIQSELLRFLKEFQEILEKEGISYFVCGGTMIGAIREKGFIPWDDDIDLFMTRENYDKLLNLARENDGKIGIFDIASGELENSLLPFCKVFDKRYKLNAKGVEGDEDYLFLDIFPLDAIPDDEDEANQFFREIDKRRKYVSVSRIKYSYLFKITKNKLLFPAKILMKLYTQIVGEKKILRDYIDFCKKYQGQKTKYINCVLWGQGEIDNVPTDGLETSYIQFEDMKVPIFKAYDFYLSRRYGDYMKRPKASERESHEIEIIKVSES